jgi:regulator of sigma E protease
MLANVTWLLNVLKVAFGLGFVIFLHELGHFLLAKWNGVKVEKFSIGFGRTLLGFKRGETEYVLAAIPLGGFVKMLGEGPEDEANKSSDPRAYPNKTVGARMAIISAGVIMNLILGWACFVYAHTRGMDEVPAKLGGVKAGSPAYEAGLQPGDEIVSIDGRTNLDFVKLRLKVSLSSEGQKLHFVIRRPGVKDLLPLEIEPRREPTDDMPSIGVTQSGSLVLSSLSFEPPPGMINPPSEKEFSLKEGDILQAVRPEGEEKTIAIESVEELHQILARYQDRTLIEYFERPPAQPRHLPSGLKPISIPVTLPPNHFVDFGFRLTIEPVSTIRAGSPAEKAGFRKGDLIVAVDGDGDFDPMRLPSLVYEKARAKESMTFEVKRAGTDPAGSTVSLTVMPDETPPWTEPAFPTEPLKVAGLGLAYPVRTRIVAIREGSPAAKAGLKVGDVISSMTVLPPPEKDEEKEPEKPKPVELKFDEKTADWPRAFTMLQLLPKQAVKLTINNAKTPLSITPEPDLSWFHPLRGLRFQTRILHMPPQSFSAAVQKGWDDSIDNVLGIYAMLRSLFQQRVSTKALGGPPQIIQMAYKSAESSFTDLVYFLGILSINLAVLNFLPIPPLDGGQMMFLIAEKVRGRPLPDSAVIAGSWLGLVLVLCLMVFVIFQDVARMMF